MTLYLLEGERWICLASRLGMRKRGRRCHILLRVYGAPLYECMIRANLPSCEP